jgi:hypothetical protein
MAGCGRGREDWDGARGGGCGLGGSGGTCSMEGGPWCLEVSLTWRVAAGRDEGLESERWG